LRKNAQKYKQSKRKQKNGTAESICHAVSPSTAHGLPALSQVRLCAGFFLVSRHRTLRAFSADPDPARKSKIKSQRRQREGGGKNSF